MSELNKNMQHEFPVLSLKELSLAPILCLIVRFLGFWVSPVAAPYNNMNSFIMYFTCIVVGVLLSLLLVSKKLPNFLAFLSNPDGMFSLKNLWDRPWYFVFNICLITVAIMGVLYYFNPSQVTAVGGTLFFNFYLGILTGALLARLFWYRHQHNNIAKQS